jgi:hypothetical protein
VLRSAVSQHQSPLYASNDAAESANFVGKTTQERKSPWGPHYKYTAGLTYGDNKFNMTCLSAWEGERNSPTALTTDNKTYNMQRSSFD